MRQVELTGLFSKAAPRLEELPHLVEAQHPRVAAPVALHDEHISVGRKPDVVGLIEEPRTGGLVQFPACPFVPSVSRTLPSALIFVTVWPFTSVVQMFPAGSTRMPCDLT